MPVNLNPPPLPTPDTARSAQAPAPIDDDPVAADLFAQLVAAAATTTSPLNAGKAEPPADDASRDSDAPAADVSAIDAAMALALMPVALPFVAHAKTSDAMPARDATQQASATTALSRNERTTRLPRAETLLAATPDKNVERTDASVARNANAELREALAAALAPRSSPAPSPSSTTASAHDARSHEAPAAAPAATKPSPPQPPAIAAALSTLAERDRAPERASRERLPSIDAAAVQTPAAAASRPVAPPAVLAIDAPVGAPSFADEVATKIAHVVLRNERAELRVSPPELGPVEIRIDVKSDSASLTIVAAQPATREALEQALPQLRDSLAAQGISLGQTAIHDGRAQGERSGRDTAFASARAGDADDGSAPVIAATRIRLSDRLVDTFA